MIVIRELGHWAKMLIISTFFPYIYIKCGPPSWSWSRFINFIYALPQQMTVSHYFQCFIFNKGFEIYFTGLVYRELARLNCHWANSQRRTRFGIQIHTSVITESYINKWQRSNSFRTSNSEDILLFNYVKTSFNKNIHFNILHR